MMQWVKKSENTTINEIITSSGDVIRDPHDIADHINTHFVNIGPKLASEVLFSVDSSRPEDYLSQTNSRFKFSRIMFSS